MLRSPLAITHFSTTAPQCPRPPAPGKKQAVTPTQSSKEVGEGTFMLNVIVGPNQIVSVHCFGDCTLTDVQWTVVCGDTFKIKEQSAGDTTTINGGGMFGAEDKII